MRIFLFITLAFFFSKLTLAQSPLSVRTDFNVSNLSLEDALIALSEQTEINIAFSNQLIPKGKMVSINRTNTSVKNVLEELLLDTNIQYKVVEEQIILSKRPPPPARKYTISGYLEDAQTGEPLIEASVVIANTTQGVSSNNYGFYSLTVEEGPMEIQFLYLGYQMHTQEVKLHKDLRLNIKLEPSLTLPPVIVRAVDKLPVIENKPAAVPESLPIEQIRELPSLGGEADIWRSSYLQSGVQTGTDGVGGLLVRGGSVDQNLVLLDGVVVYNPTHAIGIFSIFNTNTVQSANLFKGNPPARYGGRLSSVMDIRTREGYLKKYAGEISLGLIAAKASIEGPIIKDKVSFFLSGRHSLTQWYIPELTKKVKAANFKDLETAETLQNDTLGRKGFSDYSFYDLNAKLHAQLSDNNKLYLSFYKGGDDFFDQNYYGYQDDFLVSVQPVTFQNVIVQDTSNLGFSWGNTTASLRWNHLFGDQLFANTTLNYSAYNFRSEDVFTSKGTYPNDRTDHILTTEKFRLNIENWTVKTDFEYSPSLRHGIRFGLSASKQSFEPGVFFTDTKAQDVPFLNDSIAIFDTLDIVPQVAYEYSFYAEDDIQFAPWLQMNLGLRASQWSVDNTNYRSVQPRINAVFTVRPRWTIHSSYNQMVQHVHFLTKSNLGLPGDIWVPSTANIAPEKSWQTMAGIHYKHPTFGGFSVEAYYKKMDNLIAFIQSDSLVILSANDWEKNVATGQGWTYGLETSFEKTSGALRTSLSYTLAWSERQYDAINAGNRFPFRYDRRHSLKFIGQYFLNEKWNFNATWLFESGVRLTLPQLEYPFRTIYGDIVIQQPSAINEIPSPYYHRLDIGMNYTIEKEKWTHTINFGIFNVYNRLNPVFYRLRQDKKLVRVTLLPFLPSLNYTIQFF